MLKSNHGKKLNLSLIAPQITGNRAKHKKKMATDISTKNSVVCKSSATAGIAGKYIVLFTGPKNTTVARRNKM